MTMYEEDRKTFDDCFLFKFKSLPLGTHRKFVCLQTLNKKDDYAFFFLYKNKVEKNWLKDC